MDLQKMMALANRLAAYTERKNVDTFLPPGDGTAESPLLISELGHLAWVMVGINSQTTEARYFQLMNDIDAGGTKFWNDGHGFDPIGYFDSEEHCVTFNGIFDGNGYTIRNLYINRPDRNCVGLFGRMGTGAVIKNLALECANINGYDFVGALVGMKDAGRVHYCRAAGYIAASGCCGGLIGRNVGSFDFMYSCAFTGTVKGGVGVGGIVGVNLNCDISDSRFVGSIIAQDNAGGIAGYNNGGNLSNCFVAGPITSGKHAGTIMGANCKGTVSSCYWNRDCCCLDDGVSDNDGSYVDATAKYTAEMRCRDTFRGWDFDKLWDIKENHGYPDLRPKQD